MLSVLCKCENSCKGKDSAEYPSDLDITLRMRLPWAERQREMEIEKESSGWLLQRCNFLTDEDIESISELSSPSTSSLARLPPPFLSPLFSLRHGIGLTPKEMVQKGEPQASCVTIESRGSAVSHECPPARRCAPIASTSTSGSNFIRNGKPLPRRPVR